MTTREETRRAVERKPLPQGIRAAGRKPLWRVALRWLPTFFGYPLGGLASELIAGPVDGLAPALAGGAITGLVLGAVQSLGLSLSRPAAARWTAATAAGLTVGLAVGSGAVDYGTDLGDLVVQGAICGVAIGAAQAIVLRPLVGRAAHAWPVILGACWALGWAITTWFGVDVEKQYTVFGSSGALLVTALTVALPLLIAARWAS